jgi:predicted O-linked N-acetylglucosamine transferase (SPINDLY family)
MADPTTYDFGVTDAVVQPVESGGTPWSERLALLPPSLFPPADAAAFGRKVAPRSERGGGAAWPSDERRAAARRAAGLPADDPETFVFAAHNQIFKVRPALLDALANLLRGSDGGSVLWIIDHPRDAVTAVRAELLARGVTHDAIVASPFVRNRTAHVERLAAAADLFLETDGYSGGATTCVSLQPGPRELAPTTPAQLATESPLTTPLASFTCTH